MYATSASLRFSGGSVAVRPAILVGRRAVALIVRLLLLDPSAVAGLDDIFFFFFDDIVGVCGLPPSSGT